MEQHYIFVILVIVVIILIQLYIYGNTRRKISAFKSIFPGSISSYSIVEECIRPDELDDDSDDEGYDDVEELDTVKVSQIHINTQNPTLLEIRDALNMYLQKNKGAASDFHLMKDVVERYCDAQEEEISVQQPIPLYLGLMGTMVGIIVGIGFIAASGGLSSESLMGNITSLMTCVAIAMAASLVGIFCTTVISWTAKSATSKVEADKNRFYSWLQTELLPVLSGNAVNALYLLQQNLVTFNQSFRTNIQGLDDALSKVKDSSREQIELITLIKNIDIRKVAQANVEVLRELRGCTGEITVFNKYLHNVSGYLTAVNELNDKINEHLDRTAAIENMGAFFEREINQVSAREQYINKVVADVDNTLRKVFEDLSESTRNGIAQLRENSVAEYDALLRQYSAQKEEFSKMMQDQREELAARSAETIELMKEIRNLAAVKSVMEHLVKLTEGQTEVLKQYATNLKNIKQDNRAVDVEPQRFPKAITYMVGAITVVVLMAFGLYVYNSFFAEPAPECVTEIPAVQKQDAVIDLSSVDETDQELQSVDGAEIDTLNVSKDSTFQQ